jgi:hypothetical protein
MYQKAAFKSAKPRNFLETRKAQVPRSQSSLWIYALVLFTALSVGARTASAECPTLTSGSPARWTWTTLEWTYSGGLSTTAISQAASAWNSGQSFTTVQSSTGFLDIVISDSTAVPGTAEIEVFNYSAGTPQSPCYLKRSVNCSSICFNTSRIYRAEMRLNNDNIGGAGSDWASTWNLSTQDAIDRVTKWAVGHEIGHFFGLINEDSVHGCSQDRGCLPATGSIQAGR